MKADFNIMMVLVKIKLLGFGQPYQTRSIQDILPLGKMHPHCRDF